MILNGNLSVTVNQMGLIQHGEAVYFPKLLEEKNMSHMSFSTTQTAGVQFEAGKRSGKGVKSSGGWQSRRKGWRIDLIHLILGKWRKGNLFKIVLVRVGEISFGYLATIWIHHNYHVTPSPNCNCLSGIVTGATKTIIKLALFKRKGTKYS